MIPDVKLHLFSELLMGSMGKIEEGEGKDRVGKKWQRRTGDSGRGGHVGSIVRGNLVAMQKREQWRTEVRKEGEKRDGGLR